MSNPVKCSFCKRPRNEVKNLIAASPEDGPFICNRCVEMANKELEAGARKGNFEQKAKEEPLKTPKEIKAYLDEYVIGQDKAKTDIAIAVYNHFKRRKAKEGKIEVDVVGPDGTSSKEEVEIDKSNIILLGPSGTGKTHIARSIARMLNVPFFVGDATRLTQAGYVGDDVETLLQGLIQEAQGDLQRAEWGIVFLDEIDKIARKGGRDRAGYRDVSGEGVQQSLLKLLEGSKVNVPRGGKAGMMTTYDTIDTTNVLFIVAGSFAGIEPIIEQRINKGAKLGFGSQAREKIDQTKTYLSVTEEDLLEFGIIPEMMGRLPVLTTTVELTEDDMIKVLTEPRNSIVKQFRALFQMDNGIHLEFETDALRAVAREAKKRPTGARALRSIVELALRQIAYEVPNDTRGIERILVTEQTIKDGSAVYTFREEDKGTQAKEA